MNYTKVPRTHKSIQQRILTFTLTCVLCMCIMVGSVSYFIFQSYLQRTAVMSAETNIKLLADSIDGSINEVYKLVRFCQSNAEIASYIRQNKNSSSVLSVSTYNRFNEEYMRNASYPYIPRTAVISGNKYLQLVTATYSSTINLATEIPKLPYFDTLLNDSSYNFSTGIIPDPFHRVGRKIIPIIRPIIYNPNTNTNGYVFMEVSVDLFTDAMKNYNTAANNNIYLTISGHTYLYENKEFGEISPRYTLIKDMSSSAFSENIIISTINDENGKKMIFVTAPLNMPDCYISQNISYYELPKQTLFFVILLISTIIGILAIGLFLMYMLNRMIAIPVSKINARVLRIADGDFTRDPSIEWNHELGDIGKGINDLSESVNVLMNKRLEDEKQKKDLEYKMLQSQINPHFLYNTLNSIKWMATIQGATGISDMSTALSCLLKSISKGTNSMITIREELSLLENYFTIQSYRYGNTIEMDTDVEDNSLYESLIIKFTLQPLVENAIFHGIEPKGSTGHIHIHIRHEGENICIDITDDGIGMSEEKALQILKNNDDSSPDFFREIGVSNVNKRLQYEFGDKYGITIKSEEGFYTTMSIHIPNLKQV